MSPYLDPLHKVLILTPDSIASTYCQRIITYYLNYHNHTTVNWHDLVNHFSESYGSLLSSLTASQYSTVARLSLYRLTEVNLPHNSFLKGCNIFFKKKIVLRRCSFETALSLAMRVFHDHPLNVYSQKEFEKVFYSTQPSDIPIKIFDEQLRHLERHYVWVDLKFSDLIYVSHENLIFDTDSTLNDIFGYENDNLNLVDLNKNMFLYYRGLADKSEDFKKYEEYNKSLKNKFPQFPFNLTAKKFTLSEKLSKVTNFDELHDHYSAKKSNYLETVSKSDLNNRITREDKFFGLS